MSSGNISVRGIAKDGLPSGFVYLDELIDDCIVDAKYAGTDNFLGCPVAGYERPLAVATEQAARALRAAADRLRPKGLILKVFDAYRPQRAVDHFARWAQQPDDCRRKPVHYPEVDKSRMFELGYIAARSGHSRGSAIDLTLVDSATHQELDMGSIFDFMDPRSHLGAPGLSALQQGNRALLKGAMEACGFLPYDCEWWHFSLRPEPHPEQAFDFPIR